MTNEEAVRIMIAHQRALEDDTAIFSDKMQKVIAKDDEAFRMAISALERGRWIPFKLNGGACRRTSHRKFRAYHDNGMTVLQIKKKMRHVKSKH